MTLKSGAKFEEKLALGSINDMRNLINFNASSCKSENVHFDVITMKNDAKFEKELICALKNDTRNLANLDSILESLKICTLMGSF